MTKKQAKQPTKRQQRADAQLKAMHEFGESIEKPFRDLKPYRGESEMMRNFLSVSSILRRMRLAEAAGMIPLHGPERRVFNKLKADVVDKHFWLLNGTTGECVTRRIREGAI